MRIPNTNIYLNIDKKIIYHKETNSKTIFDTTDDIVTIKLNSGEIIKKNIEWILHLINLKLEYPIGIQYMLDHLVFKKYKPHGVSKDYPYICLFDKEFKLEYKNETYYYIARRPGYCISKGGKVILVAKSNIEEIKTLVVETADLKSIYKLVKIYDTFRNKISLLSIHRLLATMFIPNNDYVLNNVVDHIDGNKMNNSLDNLAWISSARNTAKKRNKNFKDRYAVRNIYTRETIVCGMQREISNIIGFSTKVDFQVAKLRLGKIWRGKNGIFEIKDIDSSEPWYYLNTRCLDKSFMLVNNDGSREYIFSRNKVIEKYCSMGELDKIKPSDIELADYISKKHNINLYTNSLDHPYIIKQARNIKTNKIYTMDTGADIAKLIGTYKTEVTNIIALKKESRIINGEWQVRGVVDPNKKWEKPEEFVAFNKPKQVILEKEDGMLKIPFSSVNVASKYIKKDPKTILKYINKQQKFFMNNNWYFIKWC